MLVSIASFLPIIIVGPIADVGRHVVGRGRLGDRRAARGRWLDPARPPDRRGARFKGGGLVDALDPVALTGRSLTAPIAMHYLDDGPKTPSIELVSPVVPGQPGPATTKACRRLTAMPRVAMVFTGGTISMRPDAAAGGNVPVLDGAAILALAPGVAASPRSRPIDWGMVPASHLRFAQMLSIARSVDEALSRPEIDGVVVVQGTDTIEETAFAYDLLIALRQAVVVTGAMRDASAPDYDGPRNLADAVRVRHVRRSCAATACVVVLDGHGRRRRRDVVKTRHDGAWTRSSRATASRWRSSIDGSLVPWRRAGRAGCCRASRTRPLRTCYLVTAVAGIGRRAGARHCVRSRPRGLVVAATGAGNTAPDLLPAAS